MGIISRLGSYYKRHGVKGTFERLGTFLSRLPNSNRLVIYYYDLPKIDSSTPRRTWPDHLSFVRITRQDQMDPAELDKIINFWNPEAARRNFEERFKASSTLWLARSEGKLAGFGWTLIGSTIDTHFFPLGANDAHLFDFLVFPEQRGKQINPMLVTYILDQLAAEGRTRAHIEAAEWNKPQLTSLAKTPFKISGVARKGLLFGRTVVEWGKPKGLPSPDGVQVAAGN